MTVRVPARKPRSLTSKGLANFARRQIERARGELILIAGAYADVDQGVVNDVDEVVGHVDRLEDTIKESETSGRDAL